MLKLLRRPPAGKSAAGRLYDAAVEKSRSPALYSEMAAPDTVEGRFELLTVHVLLAIARANAVEPLGRDIGQALFDIYLRNLDGALREMGVGDLAVGKRMKKLGQIFYGRGVAYEAAFNDPDPAALEALVARTVLNGDVGKNPRPLAEYLCAERGRLASLADESFLPEARA